MKIPQNKAQALVPAAQEIQALVSKLSLEENHTSVTNPQNSTSALEAMPAGRSTLITVLKVLRRGPAMP